MASSAALPDSLGDQAACGVLPRQASGRSEREGTPEWSTGCDNCRSSSGSCVCVHRRSNVCSGYERKNRMARDE